MLRNILNPSLQEGLVPCPNIIWNVSHGIGYIPTNIHFVI